MLTIWGCSSNIHSDVIVSSTLQASLNDCSTWCIGGCVVCYYISKTIVSKLHCHRCHTLRWYSCVPCHSNSRSWTTHTLSTHSNNSEEWKLNSCMYESTVAIACSRKSFNVSNCLSYTWERAWCLACSWYTVVADKHQQDYQSHPRHRTANGSHDCSYRQITIPLTTVRYHAYAIQWFIWLGWG